MICQRLAAFLFALFLSSHICIAQQTSDVFTPKITGTTTLTVPLESLYTAWSQPTATETYTFSQNAALTTATYTYAYYGGLESTDVAVATGYTISNFSNGAYAYCWYQTSGNWALLPRVLFYLTIVAALVLRKHDWIVAGALAASLTFSGVAAIQISFQVWMKQAVADLDLYPILGILSTSCLVAIPLLNWSETIRYLGLTEAEKRNKRKQKAREGKRMSRYGEENLEAEKFKGNESRDSGGPTLTILVFWALLVAVGFLSALVGFIDMRLNNNQGYVSLYTYSGADTVHCVPDNGILDLNAGQLAGWVDFWFNDEFVSKNNCENPCTKLPDGQRNLFRSNQDLAVLTSKQIDNLLEKSNISEREDKALRFTSFYFSITLYGLVFIVVQGFMHFLYSGRHSPREARTLMYRAVVKAKDPIFTPTPSRQRLARLVALVPYFLAIVILSLTPFALIINVVATELFLYVLPQSEDNRHVGQWGVMVGTGLVLIAALISRFEPGVRRYLHRAKTQGKKSWRHHRKPRDDKVADEEDELDSKRPEKLRRQSSYVPDKALMHDIWESIVTTIYNTGVGIIHWLRTPLWMIGEEWRMFRHWMTNPLDWPQPSERPRPKYRARKKSAQAKPIMPASIVSPQFEGYGSQDIDHFDTKDSGIDSRVAPAAMNEPLLAHNPSIGNNLANRPGRSVALTKQPGTTRHVAITTSPPPLGQRQNSYNRKPVPVSSAAMTPLQNHATPQLSPYEVSPLHQPQTSQYLSPEPIHRPQRDSSQVMASINDSIANRSRRSNVYSPEPEDDDNNNNNYEHHDEAIDTADPETHLSPRTIPAAHMQTQPQQSSIPSASQTPRSSRSVASTHSRNGLIPISIEPNTDDIPPLPPTKTMPTTTDAESPAIYSPTTGLPPLSGLASRSSYLFSEEELARLYKAGTPHVRSVLASRSSMAHLTAAATGSGADALDRVSYLQIQSGGAGAQPGTDQEWGNQVVLRRDRDGRWIVVDDGRET